MGPIKKKSSDLCKTLRSQTFQVQGPSLFNRLPRYLRDNSEDTPDDWKVCLDKYLADIPDQPVTTFLSPWLCDRFSASPTNSIGDWILFKERTKQWNPCGLNSLHNSQDDDTDSDSPDIILI